MLINYAVKVEKYGIVLGHLMSVDGVLSSESRLRADEAARLMTTGLVDIIVVTGGAYRKDTTLTISRAMANYLVGEHRIPIERIIIDANSLDTVGDAFFLRKNIFMKKPNAVLHIITSGYHIFRTKRIFRFVFGNSCKMCFHPVFLDFHMGRLFSELRSIMKFAATFRGVRRGDLKSIEKTLRARHTLYMGMN
jgi:uncharacterized SAM-binding protein YcdF (DUF218 family)